MNKSEFLRLLENLPEDIEFRENLVGLSIYHLGKFLGYVDFLHKKMNLVQGENK
jgi:hypothetical protein